MAHAQPVQVDVELATQHHAEVVEATAAQPRKNDFVQVYEKTQQVFQELKTECIPSFDKQTTQDLADFVKHNIHVPYVPALVRPGWLTRYVLGPFNADWGDSLISDFTAGLTVSLTLIPQALSYAQLANLPPVYGLYSAIVPAAIYAVLGSSMQLSVGPTAVLSLLTGSVLTSSGANYTDNLSYAVDVAAQTAFQAGLLLFLGSFLNLGNFIRFISYPVMSGFTTGAAMTIGLNQVKNAFGFGSEVPTIGEGGDKMYNYQLMQWYLDFWNGTKFVKQTSKTKMKVNLRNPHATAIFVGLVVPMFLMQILKKVIKSTPERKRTIWFKCWTIFVNSLPLIAIIVGARVAKTIVESADAYPSDYYAHALKVVGTVPEGLDIFRAPTFRKSFFPFFLDVLPLTLVLYMESYAIARKIAADFGFLSLLNASQEMFAVGLGNMLGCVSSAYPVCGSFSRSALNANSGAQTPLSKSITVLVIVIVTGTLTSSLRWIPQAALSAVIMVSLMNLIDIQAFWNAWKYSKKDFLVMITTMVITFCFDTGTGLATGIILSVILLMRDMGFNLEAKPVAKSAKLNGVIVIRLHNNLVFISGGRIKDALYNEVFKKYDDEGSEAVRAVVVDFIDVHFVDFTGLISMREIIDDARSRGIPVVLLNVLPAVQTFLDKAEIVSDKIETEKLELAIDQALPLVGSASEREKGLPMESLATVDQLLQAEQKMEL